MRLLQVARLSVEKSGQTGMDTQDEKVRTRAKHDGDEIVGVAMEFAKGPSDPFKRAELGPWLTDPMRVASFDGIIASKPDRLSRSTYQAIRLRHWCETHDKVLIVTDPAMTWPVPKGQAGIAMKMLWSMLEVLAEGEWDATSARYRDMKTTLRAAGALTTRPSFGGAVEGEKKAKKLVWTDLGRKYVPMIFERCIAGDSLATIATWLMAEGVESPDHYSWSRQDPEERRDEPGNAWHSRSVAIVLRNRTYTGFGLDAAGTIILRCEALVPMEIFEAAQAALTGRVKGRRTYTRENPGMLSGGVLRCARCGAPMYRMGGAYKGTNPHFSRRTFFYYRCYGTDVAGRNSCKNLVRLDRTDAKVEELMALMTGEIREPKLIPGNNHEQELAQVKYQMKQLSPALTDDEYDAELTKLRTERDRLTALPAIPNRVELVPTGTTYAEKWAALPNAERADWLKKVGLTFAAEKGEEGSVELNVIDATGLLVLRLMEPNVTLDVA